MHVHTWCNIFESAMCRYRKRASILSSFPGRRYHGRTRRNFHFMALATRAKLFTRDSSFHAGFNLIEKLARRETRGRNADVGPRGAPERYHQTSQPRRFLGRKLKIQRAEGNFGDREQGPRAKAGQRIENGKRCWIRPRMRWKRKRVAFDIIELYSWENSYSEGTTLSIAETKCTSSLAKVML